MLYSVVLVFAVHEYMIFNLMLKFVFYGKDEIVDSIRNNNITW